MTANKIDWFYIDIDPDLVYTDDPMEVGSLNVFFDTDFVGYFVTLQDNEYVKVIGIDENSTPYRVMERHI